MKLRAGILGATGAVGQKFISLLQDHPWFEVSAVAASERSAGKLYGDAAHWLEESEIPSRVAELTVQDASHVLLDCDFVFSGLDSSVAGEIEERYARAGYPVISNAKNFRMNADVPLLIPEVNPEHLGLIDTQKWGSDGYIVTNPNCASVGLTMALKPLHDAFGIELVHVTTMQALSGAGYPGVPSLDSLANVVPFISGEEDKVESEPLKILGKLSSGQIQHDSFSISATCTRVPVIDGHLATVSVKLRKSASPEAAIRAINAFTSPSSVAHLPGSPEKALQYSDDASFPQPRRHANAGQGMTVSVGRMRACPILDLKFVCLAHNTIRGAAGGAILNAELLASQGKIKHRSEVHALN
ncbi:aspartate-semialdehyde dehydrogenase [bacterium]|nr:aspartate-semialdehyde dehydrogenase [bacterium]